MPISAAALARAGTVAIANYARNKPTDSITHPHLFLDKLIERKKETASSVGGKVYQIRKSNTTGVGGLFAGDDTVAYGSIDSIGQATYKYWNVHDGFFLTEDDLKMAGISLIETNQSDSIVAAQSATADEKVAITNLMKEQLEVLDESMRQKLNSIVLLDGSQNALAPVGLDGLVSLTPTTGTVGGINRATAPYWRNNVATGILAGTYASGGNLIEAMEKQYRNCMRFGGEQPDLIMVGEDWYDAMRSFYKLNMAGGLSGNEYVHIKAGTDDMTFHGIPIEINYDFIDLDALLNPTVKWAKRCYMLNMRHIKLEPVRGQWMQTRTPARPTNQYVTSWGLTNSAYLTMDKASCHAVLALA